MKKIVVVVVVLAAVLLLAPYGVGKIAEGRMNRGLDKLVEQAPYLVIAERKWTGGWFKSRQEVTFEVASPFADAVNAGKLEELFKKEAVEGDVEQAATDEAAPAEAETPAEDAAATDEAASAEAETPSSE